MGGDDHSQPQGGLPRELSSFVGRSAEQAAVERRLGESPLVTLTGPGGCGKSRLALRVAATVQGRYGGAHLVELAPLADPTLVAATVAQALGWKDRAGTSPVDSVVEAVGDRDLLLVLDNCEHLVDDVAALVVAVLERCGALSILATSRQRLDLPGEVVFPVSPLGLPAQDERSARGIATAEAVMLFVDRATAAEPSFALTDANAASVAEICVHLDGIPLAIELAAARVAVLAPHDIAAHLDDRFGLLAGGRNAPARHQTLRSLVQWSYDLLDEAERRMLARLSIFRDGFELPAAAAVAGADPPLAPDLTVAVLAALVERSLVQAHHSGTTRYSMLETIRSFAAERLVEHGEEQAMRRRHLQWASELARAAEAELGGPAWARWDARLATERANLRAALGWSLQGPDAPLGRDLAARLARWWFVTGQYAEGRQFLVRALSGSTAETAAIRSRLLVGAGWCSYHLGNGDEAERLGQEGLDAALAAEEAFLAAWARILLAGLAWSAGDGDEVRRLLAGASEWAHFPAAAALAARASVLLSNVTFVAGDLAEAARIGENALRLAREAPGHENLALALAVSAHPAIAAGEYAAARSLLDEALETASASGDHFAEAIVCHSRARLFSALGDVAEAGDAARRCWTVGRHGGVRLVEALGPFAESNVALAEGRRDDAEAKLQQAVAGGRAMGLVAFVPGWLADSACLAARRGAEHEATESIAAAQTTMAGHDELLTTAMLTFTRAVLAGRSGDLPDAERHARGAVNGWYDAGAHPLAADGVEALGTLACRRGRWDDGVRLLAAGSAARDRLGYQGTGPAALRAEAAEARRDARRELGDEAVDRLWAEGVALGLDGAVDYARRRSGGRTRPDAGWESLTPTEVQVAQLVAEGLRNDAIARRLFVTPGTVKNHLSHIFAKLGLSSRTELAAELTRRTG